MKAEEIADAAIQQIKEGTNFLAINFANADMVGHTANQPAIKIAVETVDQQLGRIIREISKSGGTAVITADHGNAEINIDPETGEKHTAHSINPVPCIVTIENSHLQNGTLADIAPTILEILKLKKPKAMIGKSLLI
jgi:2,3-bisphosphoglycerate-independent phosphoglycerate mutase